MVSDNKMMLYSVGVIIFFKACHCTHNPQNLPRSSQAFVLSTYPVKTCRLLYSAVFTEEKNIYIYISYKKGTKIVKERVLIQISNMTAQIKHQYQTTELNKIHRTKTTYEGRRKAQRYNPVSPFSNRCHRNRREMKQRKWYFCKQYN